ncbi:hypothetical protein GCM10017667_60270 [Streptomyces filamentosus]|uniref:Uncharacterized protein n=1 Tax=Streptomyces filamentosus TaxID=67294 RepID=A0A919EQE9_STRFL|nr:hypothetical protein GCM10017667_60270 [Streptomyces filamentosus]
MSSGFSIRSQPQYAAQRSTRCAIPADTQAPISSSAARRPRRPGPGTAADGRAPAGTDRSARTANHPSSTSASAEPPYCAYW